MTSRCRRGLTGAAVIAGITAFGLAASTGAAGGAVRKDYAYMLVQGTISDPSGARPLIGATVRLSAGSLQFETLTDGRGIFLFEKLPVASYEMTVRDARGTGVESFEPVGPGAAAAGRFRVRLGAGEPGRLSIEAAEGEVRLVAPDRPASWRRFWTQFAIFAGCAAALAL